MSLGCKAHNIYIEQSIFNRIFFGDIVYSGGFRHFPRSYKNCFFRNGDPVFSFSVKLSSKLEKNMSRKSFYDVGWKRHDLSLSIDSYFLLPFISPLIMLRWLPKITHDTWSGLKHVGCQTILASSQVWIWWLCKGWQ